MEHQNLHFGNRPYACTQCDKKFAARSNLIQHRTVHKRPFQCTLCNKRFDKEDQLKKHMYAHPQTMLQCTICKKNCNNENELKKHIAKVHPNDLSQQAVLKNVDVSQQAAVKAEPVMTQNGMLGDIHGMSPMTAPGGVPALQAPMNHQGSVALALGQQNTEPISPPAGASPDGHAQAPHTPPGHTTPPARAPPMLNERGQRIDAICSQLVTSISNPLPPESPHTPPTPNHYHDSVIIKKEQQQQQQHHDPRHYTEFDAHHQEHSQSPRIASTGSAEYQAVSGYSSQEMAAARAAMNSHPPQAMMVDDIVPKEEGQGQIPALPGIHEMFSRRSTPKLPPFNSGVFSGTPPLLTTSVADMKGPMNLPNDLPLNLMSPPPAASVMASAFPTAVSSPLVTMATAGGVTGHLSNTPTPTQTPMPGETTPQRTITPHPPNALPNHDQATQHSTPIPGFPCLDDVINYYVNQGAIFKCQHCNVVFFERGMFFLHASLHSSSNPWECSICNKVCTDRNEFTLHFVNQQHT